MIGDVFLVIVINDFVINLLVFMFDIVSLSL